MKNTAPNATGAFKPQDRSRPCESCGDARPRIPKRWFKSGVFVQYACENIHACNRRKLKP